MDRALLLRDAVDGQTAIFRTHKCLKILLSPPSYSTRHPTGLMLEDVLILLFGTVVAVALFRRIHLPAILGYLFAGMVLGPHGLGLMADSEATRNLAELGVVLLLFTVGLEFSWPQLVALRHVVLGLGSAKVIACTVLGALGAWWAGLNPAGAFVVGGALALSSTAIALKQLPEQVELHSRHGRNALGILLFQDLAVVPFLIVIPLLGTGVQSISVPLVVALAKGGLVFVALLAAGRWLLRPLFHEIAAARSPELFMLLVLLITLAAAWTTHALGLSLALGGFLAGMMLSETEYRHQVEADIRPFRDILLGLFFVTVGMLLDFTALARSLHWVLAVTLALIVLKTIITAVVVRSAGHAPGVALRTGLVLAQGGEFSFALLSIAATYTLLPAAALHVVFAAVLLSMMLAPLVMRHNGRIAHRVFPVSYPADKARQAGSIVAQTAPLSQHVIICGYGRVGQNIMRLLAEEGFECVALDLDPERVHEAHEAGERVHYGDSARRDILRAAGIERASALVVSYDDVPATLKILSVARDLRPDLPVLVRTRDDANLEHFKAQGATEVVPEKLEASLMLVSHVLLLLDVPMARILRRLSEIRADRYRLLRGFFHGQALATQDAEAYRERLHSVALPEGAYAVGRELHALALDDSGVLITALRRNGIVGPQPDHTTRLRAGDVLVLYGTPERLEHAEGLLLKG